jgi:hypothetical protein
MTTPAEPAPCPAARFLVNEAERSLTLHGDSATVVAPFVGWSIPIDL